MSHYTRIDMILSLVYTTFLKLYYRRIRMGRKAIVYYRSRCYNLSKKGSIVIGANSSIGRGKRGFHVGLPFYTTLLNDGIDSHLIIGDNCRINGAYIHSKKSIIIGENCVISANVNIMDSNGHEVVSYNRTVGRDTPREIIIGNNVWIGTNCTILKGTIIGDNCVIGAGCVIKGHIPANHVVTQANVEISPIRYC